MVGYKEAMSERNHAPQQRELLSDHQVFTDVFEIQRKLEEARFLSPYEAYQAGMNMLAPLQREVYATDLVEKPVTLTGFDIVMPDVDHEPVTGMETIDPVYVDAHDELNTDDDSDVSRPPIEGAFYGFHAAAVLEKPKGNVDEDTIEAQAHNDTASDEYDDMEPIGYRVIIHYRVAISGVIQMGNVVGRLCAEGNISCTALEFKEDKRVKDGEKALLALSDETPDEQTARVSAEIDDLLTAHEGSDIYDHQRLARLGESLRDHETNRGVNKRYRDAVLSLVEARLGIYPGDTFTVGAADGIAKIDDSYTIIRTVFEGPYEVLGLAFSPNYQIRGDKGVITQDLETLAVVVQVPIEDDEDDDKHAYCYIPFDKLTELTPVT